MNNNKDIISILRLNLMDRFGKWKGNIRYIINKKLVCYEKDCIYRFYGKKENKMDK